jgi:hypothetical protein
VTDEDETAAGEMLPCPHCDGIGVWYGLAPHTHDLSQGTFIGSTRLEPKNTWPNNFHEDPECAGCGTWTCPVCDGQGVVEPDWQPEDEAEDVTDTDAEEHFVDFVDVVLAPLVAKLEYANIEGPECGGDDDDIDARRGGK